jgi:hypothetical protein
MLLVLLFRAISRGIGAPSMSAGDEGEYYVARHLSKLNSRKYFVINDLVFRKKNGLTCQIDHVVVSPYGVFVIETKNIYGYIHGSEKSKLWRSYWKNGRDLAFDNPVQQNTAHIEALSERLGVGLQIPYYSIIAFTPTADLQVDVKGADVIYWTKIDSVIQWYTDPVLSIEEAKNIYTNILAMNIVDPEVRNKHGREASARKANFEEQTNIALDNGKCPKCGGRLVKRQGTYGAFYGCSNYPSCRYTHPAA